MIATEFASKETSHSGKFHYLTNFPFLRLRMRNHPSIFLLQLTLSDAKSLLPEQRINLKIAALLYKYVSAELNARQFLQQSSAI
jgi:hypothetical protein